MLLVLSYYVSMSVKFAMLSLLSDEPAHGYRLRQRFEEKIGDFWQLNGGQVYQTLKTLERDGWIEVLGPAPDPTAMRASRESVQYQLTDEGRAGLRKWLAKPATTPEPHRDEILVRLLVLDDAAEVETRRFIRHEQEIYSHYLVCLSSKKRRLPSEIGKETLAARLGIEAAISHASAHLEWLGYCIELLDQAGDNAVAAAPEAATAQEVEAVPPLPPTPQASEPQAPEPPAESVAAMPEAPAREATPAPGPQTAALPPLEGVRLIFAEGTADLSDAVKRDLGRFAKDLLGHDQQRIQLLAYAKGTADAASQARRLSLARALAVRSYLMAQGVLPTRMDVRALGNKADDDPRDRVDVELAQR